MTVSNLIEAVESSNTAQMHDLFTKIMQEKAMAFVNGMRKSILENALGILEVDENLEQTVKELSGLREHFISFALSDEFAALSEDEKHLFQNAFEEII